MSQFVFTLQQIVLSVLGLNLFRTCTRILGPAALLCGLHRRHQSWLNFCSVPAQSILGPRVCTRAQPECAEQRTAVGF